MQDSRAQTVAFADKHSEGLSHRIWNFWLHRPETPSAVFLIALLVVLSITTRGFLTVGNLVAIVDQVAVVAIVALLLNQVILAGEIDVSVGSLVAVCCYVYCFLAVDFGGWLLPLGGSLLAGLILGAFNGFLATYGRVPSFVATVGTQFVLRGILLSFMADYVLTLDASSRPLGLGTLLGIPASIAMMIAVLIVVDIMGRHTSYGRNVYAVGGNVRAARVIGLAVNKIRISAFCLTGLSCGLAAAVLVGQIGQIQPTVATGLELRAIAAVVLGGTSIIGGRGSTYSPVVGALLVGVIMNAMTLNRVPGTFELLVLGALILMAVSVDGIRQHLSKAR